MAGKKDYSVVNVTTGLTRRQAGEMVSAICKAKNTIAPNSRSTASVTTKEGVKSILQDSIKQICGK